MRKIVIGVMGPGETATPKDLSYAYELGRLIAQQGWVLLSGGRNVGVMDAASHGAKAAEGLTVGILPYAHTQGISEAVDLVILTDLGNARNNINVLSSDVVIACGMGLGTASEIALALKNGNFVVLLSEDPLSQQFFTGLGGERLILADSPESAVAWVREFLK